MAPLWLLTLSPPALGARRQHLEFEPVGDLAGAQLLVEDVLADAVAPSEPLVARVAVELVELGREGLDLGFVEEEALVDQPRPDAARDRCDLVKRIFRMILHAPGGRAVAADLGALHGGDLVGGE